MPSSIFRRLEEPGAGALRVSAGRAEGQAAERHAGRGRCARGGWLFRGAQAAGGDGRRAAGVCRAAAIRRSAVRASAAPAGRVEPRACGGIASRSRAFSLSQVGFNVPRAACPPGCPRAASPGCGRTPSRAARWRATRRAGLMRDRRARGGCQRLAQSGALRHAGADGAFDQAMVFGRAIGDARALPVHGIAACAVAQASCPAAGLERGRSDRIVFGKLDALDEALDGGVQRAVQHEGRQAEVRSAWPRQSLR